MRFWETITSWLSCMWAFVLTISFLFITGLNKAEESRNYEDLDFKEKNKWNFIDLDCASPCNEALREFQVNDMFYQMASNILLTHLLFSTLMLPVVIYKKFIIAFVTWNLSDCFVFLQFLQFLQWNLGRRSRRNN